MSSRMTDASTPLIAEAPTIDTTPGMPRVKVVLTLVKGADLGAALATVDRQVYDSVEEVTVIADAGVEVPDGINRAGSLVDAINSTSHDVEYLWIIHSDARPRPDALSALVAEVERNDASLGGSKLLVAGSRDELESIGSATDVFGEPFSGLDEGEIDLQQYDVVREVAFVSSVSMLIRRDLAQGLRGLDDLLEPVAAGLDFSQRVRLAGGKVITIPSSEVYHQGRCRQAGRGWREQAGRLRAMLKAYRPITLAWVVPFELLVALVDSLASLLLLRWRPAARHAASWGWNLVHLPSTIGARRRFKPVRAVGDEELFRFQARGSIRLRSVGAELTERILFMFDDDKALARGTRRVWSSPGIWGALIAVALVLVASRSIIFAGVPNVGSSFEFEPPTFALQRFLGGWNDSGLGSSAAVHPSTGINALVSGIWFGEEGAARTLLTLGFAALGVIGMGRLAGRIGFRGPGRYLAGLVLLAGPGTAVAVGAGSWLVLAGAAILPWAVRSVFLYSGDTGKNVLGRVGWVVFWSLILAAFSPLLALVPLLAAAVASIVGAGTPRLWLGLVAVTGLAMAAPFLIADPGWITDVDRRLALEVPVLWPVLVSVAAIPLFFLEDRAARAGLTGAILALAGLVFIRLPFGGPGVEEALLILSSMGAALVVAAALDRLSFEPKRVIASVAAAAILVLSVGTMLDGRLGLPSGNLNEQFAFAETLAGEGGPGRILLLSTDRGDIPGEARPGPGVFYRLIDGEGMTQDEVWLPPEREGDIELDLILDRLATGVDLRPGAALAPFAIDWLVLEGDPSYLDELLQTQLDLVPTPLDATARVYENPGARPIAAGTSVIWARSGTGFSGVPAQQRITIAVNQDEDWSPDPVLAGWAMTVDGSDGVATYLPDTAAYILPVLALTMLASALGVIIVGRARR